MKIQHPIYAEMLPSWEKFRFTYAGGKAFIHEYIEKRPSENDKEFEKRVKLSHCPAHAKSNLNEIKNSIFSRMNQGVTRTGGSDTYQAAVRGEVGGVDRKHSSMTGFIASSILPELLSIGKVGIWVDAPIAGGQPYFNVYRAEDLLSWIEDSENPGHFTQILLRRHTYALDDDFGFPAEEVETFRIVKKVGEGQIKIVDMDEDENILNTMTLNLDSIPFVIAELNESLLTDVADYQISLANLDSGDIFYCWVANVPIYVEQVDRNDEYQSFMNQHTTEVDLENSVDPVLEAHNISEEMIKQGNQRKFGATEGIGYGKGLNQPDFINPPSEPLEISLKKQEAMRNDIKELINLSLTTVRPRAASAESKALDNQGLEAGLSAIGLELQALENRLAELWSMYEETDKAQVNYPDEYELKDDATRREEAEALIKLKENFPSKTAKSIILKEAVDVLLAGKIQTGQLRQIEAEILAANGCTGNPEAISRDLENGLVSAATASKLRGYSPEEVKAAQKEKALRMKEAMEAQRGQEGFQGAKDRGEGLDATDPTKEKPDANS